MSSSVAPEAISPSRMRVLIWYRVGYSGRGGTSNSGAVVERRQRRLRSCHTPPARLRRERLNNRASRTNYRGEASENLLASGSRASRLTPGWNRRRNRGTHVRDAVCYRGDDQRRSGLRHDPGPVRHSQAGRGPASAPGRRPGPPYAHRASTSPSFRWRCCAASSWTPWCSAGSSWLAHWLCRWRSSA